MTNLERLASNIAHMFPGHGDTPRLWAEEVVRAILTELLSPSERMIEAGISKAEDCIDIDWDSGHDGESYNSYTTLRSDAPQQIFKAMISAILEDGK